MKKKDKENLPAKIIPDKAVIIQPVQKTRTMIIKEESQLINEGKKTVFELGMQLQLTRQEITFVQLYTQSAMQGYRIECMCAVLGLNPEIRQDRFRAGQAANRYMQVVNVGLLIEILMDAQGLNDQYILTRLFEIISAKDDAKTSLSGIELYLKMTGKLKKQVEVTVKQQVDMSEMSDEDLDAFVQVAQKYLSNKNQ